MALVRCPIHKIPYNADNPRGCPACAREREGEDGATAIQELARVSRALRGMPGVPVTPAPARSRSTAAPSRPSSGMAGRASVSGARRSSIVPAWPVTEPPRAPTPTESALDRLLGRLAAQRTLTAFAFATVVLVVILIVTSGPRFTPLDDPLATAGEPLLLPVYPDRDIASVFAILGPQPPQPVPGAPHLARYVYGTGLEIDALNDVVHALTFSRPNRVWQGLRPGLPERQAVGALALLGAPQEIGGGVAPLPPQQVGKYRVYPSLAERPRRTLVAEVRPPNGCFDVQVELEPRAVGILRRGDDRLAVIGVNDATLSWIVSRIRIVSRTVGGPYAMAAGC